MAYKGPRYARTLHTRTTLLRVSTLPCMRRRIQTAHPNLFGFLGHLQKNTEDNQADVARLNRGQLAVRRAIHQSARQFRKRTI